MNIYLEAYLNNNLGDDLMLDLLCRRYENHEFYIGNPNGLEEIACKNKNLHVIPSITPTSTQIVGRAINKVLSYMGIPKLQIIRFFSKHYFDLRVEIGGSIFMQVTRKSWINIVRDSKYKCHKCRKNVIIGCNFGPFTDNRFYEEHKRLFRLYDSVTFRDRYSYELFSELKNTAMYPDLVFNADIEKKAVSNTVGISVISLENRGIKGNEALYINGIIELVKRLVAVDKKVKLISFCKNEGDLQTCRTIVQMGKLEQNGVEIFDHQNIEKTLEMIQELDAIVAARFHANIIGLKMNIPTLPVIYSKKTSNVLNDIDFDGYSWDILHGESIDVDSALAQLERVPTINKDKIQGAKGHFKYLDEVLDKLGG